jgi:hypothetical protein
MSSSQIATIKLNIAQNSPSFELELIKEQALIFKKKLFFKGLNLIIFKAKSLIIIN